MSDTLSAGQGLTPGQGLRSADGRSRLEFQTDGNLILYADRNFRVTIPRWASNTAGSGATLCAMQDDGNLVIYAGGSAVWASSSHGNPNSRLVMQDDENVVVYAGATPIWSTDTWVKPPVRTSFDPARNGFHFPNGFNNVDFAGINYGFQGLCAGMSYAALDFYWSGVPMASARAAPDTSNDSLGQYIKARHVTGTLPNLGHWAAMVLNPDDNVLRRWSTSDEWNKLRALIDNNTPIPIGLGKYLDAFGSHVVVATGYQEGKGDFSIYCYDDNETDGECILYLRRNQKHWRFFGSRTGGDFRGYFVQEYTRAIPEANVVPIQDGQDNWRWCNKCEGLSFGGNPVMGLCPAGGEHNHAGSGNYVLFSDNPAPTAQRNWRWCNKCQGLAFGGNAAIGPCPAGGEHDHAGSGEYVLVQNNPGALNQSDWRWCNKCQGLAFRGNPSAGICPAGGEHDHAGSGNYVLFQR